MSIQKITKQIFPNGDSKYNHRMAKVVFKGLKKQGVKTNNQVLYRMYSTIDLGFDIVEPSGDGSFDYW